MFKAILHSLSEPQACKATTRDAESASGSKDPSELSLVSFSTFPHILVVFVCLIVCILLFGTFTVLFPTMLTETQLEFLRKVFIKLLKIFLSLFICSVLLFGVELSYAEIDLISFKVHDKTEFLSRCHVRGGAI